VAAACGSGALLEQPASASRQASGSNGFMMVPHVDQAGSVPPARDGGKRIG
jgi:hypothetical protein